MAQSYFNLVLDTLPPSGLSISLNGGAIYTSSTSVDLQIKITDANTSGYLMKIWGIAGAETESAAVWETYTPEKSVTLTDGDGMKTVHVKVSDDVGNETAAVSTNITLDTVVPIITVTGPDIDTISKVTGHDTAMASFTVNEDFVEFRVCVVPDTASLVAAGTVIPSTAGSLNTSGTGDYKADTPVFVTIKGADLAAVSPDDGEKIIKVFAKDAAGNWSTA